MKMLTIVFVLAAIVLFERTSCDDITQCFGGFCFTIPGQNASYDAANTWCRNNGSILAYVNDDNASLALTQFLNSTKKNSTIYLQYKVFKSGSTWTLLNGTNCTGKNQTGKESTYELYASLLGQSSDESAFKAIKPTNQSYFICEFNESECLHQQTFKYQSNDLCYVKFENENVTWFKARERCVNDKGDLAMVNEPWSFFQNYSLNATSYWLGIRWMNWTWNYSSEADGTSREMIYTYWSTNEPNNYTYECVCLDPLGNPTWSWSDCDCNTSRPFICMYADPNATESSTSSPSSEAAVHNDTSITINKVLAIGLGVGIGGGVLLIILIVAIVLCVKRKCRRNPGVKKGEDNSKRSPKSEAHNKKAKAVDGGYAEVFTNGTRDTGKSEKNASHQSVVYQVPTFSGQNDTESAGTLIESDDHQTQGGYDVYANV